MKVRIEMEVPEEEDLSTLLERAQALACRIAEEHDDYEDDELLDFDAVADKVSVEVIKEAP